VVALVSGCGSASDTSAEDSSGALTGEITVLAAASLTESFTTLGDQFEAAHPGTTITLSFNSSSSLASQIVNGSPGDVFASASQKNMTQVMDAEAGDEPTTFARNILEIATPPGNPARISSLDDLKDPDVTVAVCAEEVPCGVVARTVFDNAGITVVPATNEATVKAVLTKVELGEVDAGLVFVTDVNAAGDKVVGVEIPQDVNASTDYPITMLKTTDNAVLSQAFIEYVLSEDGQAVLVESGFATP
jgi:molybdate transport system substrate-binding protein